MGTIRKAIPLLLLFIACHPSAAAAGSRPRLLAYVQNIMSHSVSVIDLDGYREPRRLELGRYPLFSALSPSDPEKLLVTLHNYERREDDDAMVLFDLRSERVLKRVPFPGPGMPSGFVHDARRNRIYIADENRHRVDALDAVTLDPVFEFPAGLIPVHVDISADGKWLAVTNRKSADLYVYDLEDPGRDAKTGIFTIQLGNSPGADWDAAAAGEGISHPLDIHFAAEANRCYVSDMQARQLLVVDILKRKVVGRIPLNGSPFDFVLDRARGRAYVCLVDGETVAVVDLAAGKVAAEIKGLRLNPIHCALDDEGGRLVVSCWGGTKEGGVYVVDTRTLEVLRHFPLKGEAASIGITLVRMPEVQAQGR